MENCLSFQKKRCNVCNAGKRRRMSQALRFSVLDSASGPIYTVETGEKYPPIPNTGVLTFTNQACSPSPETMPYLQLVLHSDKTIVAAQ